MRNAERNAEGRREWSGRNTDVQDRAYRRDGDQRDRNRRNWESRRDTDSRAEWRRDDRRSSDGRRDYDRRYSDRRDYDRRDYDRRDYDRRDYDRRDYDRGDYDRRYSDRRDWDRDRYDGRRDYRRWERGRYPSVYFSSHRYRYAWRPPSGFYLRIWSYGDYYPRSWFGPGYWILDPWLYDLPLPPPGFDWVRSGPDALLIDRYTGLIIQVVRDVFWY